LQDGDFKKIKKKAYEIATAFNVPELRGSLRFNRGLDLLPAYHWSLAFSRHRADYSQFELRACYVNNLLLPYRSLITAAACRAERRESRPR
jgi:hypothetical protein